MQGRKGPIETKGVSFIGTAQCAGTFFLSNKKALLCQALTGRGKFLALSFADSKETGNIPQWLGFKKPPKLV